MSHLVIQIKTYAGLPDELHFFVSDRIHAFKIVRLDESDATQLVSLARELRNESSTLLALYTLSEERGEITLQTYRTALQTLWRTINQTHMSDTHLAWAITYLQCSLADARAQMLDSVTA